MDSLVRSAVAHAHAEMRRTICTSVRSMSVKDSSSSAGQTKKESAGLSSGIPADAAFSLTVHESESVEADSILCSEVPAALHRIHPQYGPDAVKEFADIMVEKLYTKADHTRESTSGCGQLQLLSVTRSSFIATHNEMMDKVDPRIWPIAASTLLVGSAVGVIIPTMPLLAQSMGITAADYGIVMSALALTKLLGNIPASNASDKYGRKKLLINGLLVMAASNCMIGVATSMETLVLARLMTGAGVAMFVTSSTLYSTDVSNPINRARTLAPLGIAFSVGATLGPAFGGLLTANFGISSTFFIVGGMFGAVALASKYTLIETLKVKIDRSRQGSYLDSFKQEIREWKPLMKNPDVNGMVLLNMMYWVAFGGAQMTLLPLMLIEDKFGLGPAGIGFVFMGNSLVNVIFAQPAAMLADKLGKKEVAVPALALVGMSYACFPLAENLAQAGVILGFLGIGNAFLVGMLIGSAGAGAIAEMTSKSMAMESSGSLLGMVCETTRSYIVHMSAIESFGFARTHTGQVNRDFL